MNMGIKRNRDHELGTTLTADGQIEEPNRIFKCKTCNSQFSSFQALGGHMSASHNKKKKTKYLRLLGDQYYSTGQQLSLSDHMIHISPPKHRTHQCSLCGLKFSIGQALGGHMRRHRAFTQPANLSTPSINNSNDCTRICLDLNLTL